MLSSDDAIKSHVSILEGCNQRGGRMLTLVDLIEVGTVDLSLAAYLAAVMRSRGSLLVGARPGGAGKTTVMVALLNFLPDEMVIRPIDGRISLLHALHDTEFGKTCYLAHEIGHGFYYGYVWGEQARQFMSLAGQGHTIASNLHADTLSELRAQLCEQNRVDPQDLSAVALKVFLRVARGHDFRPQRWVSYVFEAVEGEDRLIWTGHAPGIFKRQAESALISREAEHVCRELLEMLRAKGLRTMTQVRRAVVESLALS